MHNAPPLVSSSMMIGFDRPWLLIALALASTITGCAPDPLRPSFHSPSPSEKTYAIHVAVRDNDHSAIPYIIEQLGSDDPAVRMVAIAALQRLTGETHGYVHYAPRHEREEAINRWVDAHRAQAALGGVDD